MTEQGTKWLQSMIERYGSEAAVRAEMVRRQQKSMENPNRQKGVHKGGFSNKELAKQAGLKGANSRWGKSSSS